MNDRIQRLESQLAAATTELEKVDALNALAWGLKRDAPQRAIALGQMAHDLARNNSYPAGLAHSLKVLGYCNDDIGYFELALTQSLEAKALFETLGDRLGQSEVLCTLGAVQWHLGDFAAALEYSLHALHLAEEVNHRDAQGDALNIIGIIYGDTGDHAQALTIYEKVLELYRESGSKISQAMILNNIAVDHYLLTHYTEALAYGLAGLEIAQELGNEFLEETIYGTIGEIHLEMGQYDQALGAFQQSLDLSRRLKSRIHEQTALYYLGKVYYRRHEIELALTYLQQALALAEASEAKTELYQCHQLLAEIYESQGNFQQALLHHRRFYEVYQQVFNEAGDKKLKNLEVRYRTQAIQKEAEIERLRNVELEKEIAERKQAEAEAQRRTHELVALAEVGREISATLDLSTLLEQIVSQAKDLLQAVDTAVYLLQLDGRTLQAVAAASEYADEVRGHIADIETSLIGYVARSGIPEIINKPSQDSRGKRFAGSWDEKVGSDDDLYPLMLAPITIQEVVIGVIAVWRYIETGLFTPAHLNFLEALSQQAAIAIQNARLFEAEQHQRQLAESLREVAYVLSGSLDQSTVVTKILEQLGQVIKHDGAALFLQENQDLVLVAGISVNPALIGVHIPVSHSNPGARVFRQKELMVMEDVYQDPGWEIWPETNPIRAWMGAPLLVGERAIGVLTADNLKIGVYTSEDARNLQTFANHAAVAIENAHLFEAEKKAKRELTVRVEEITIFNETIQTMTRTTDLISALEVAAQTIIRFLNARNCGIALLDETKTELEVVVSVSPDNRYQSTVGIKIPVINNPSSKQVIETRQSLVITQAQQHSLTLSIHDLMRKLNTQCLMIVPLLARGEVIGTIGVDTDQSDRAFTPSEVRFVETMAGQMAGAVGVARLFEAEQRQRQLAEQRSHELEAANASLQAINAELDAFARTVAHDLKNPLGALITYGDVLISYGQQMPPDKLQFIFHELQKLGQKATNIVEELLLLAGMRKGTIKMSPLNMAEIVEEAQRRLYFTIEEYQAKIITPPSWPPALGYEPWVEEVWVNYLSNGLKYGGQPPCLELGATLQTDGMIRFWVCDNGSGLSPEEQARLFAEFIRLDEVRAQGHGLGLSIVRRIVEKLGGQVGVESAGVPGQGSTFYFTLAAG